MTQFELILGGTQDFSEPSGLPGGIEESHKEAALGKGAESKREPQLGSNLVQPGTCPLLSIRLPTQLILTPPQTVGTW